MTEKTSGASDRLNFGHSLSVKGLVLLRLMLAVWNLFQVGRKTQNSS